MNFVKILACTGVQIAKIKGAHSMKKNKKLQEKNNGPRIQVQPTRWWIRISRTPWGRWIDPDSLTLNLTAMDEEKWVGFEPTRFACYIKGKMARISHSFTPFLFLLLPSCAVLSPSSNPNPNSLNPTQKSKIHGLIASSYRSKHVFSVEIHVCEANHRGSEVLFMDFKRFRGSFFFWFKLLFWWNPDGFTGLQRWIHVVNPKILHCFEKRLGFHSFWTGPFEFAWIHVDSISLVLTRMREVSFLWFFTWFRSEIRTWIFRTLGFDSVFVVSCLKSEWNCESSPSYWPVQNLQMSLLLLNLWPLWSCLSLPLSMVNSHWNCRGNDSMMKIRCWISENHHKLHWILLNFDSGNG